jgi:hypothetical protein
MVEVRWDGLQEGLSESRYPELYSVLQRQVAICPPPPHQRRPHLILSAHGCPSLAPFVIQGSGEPGLLHHLRDGRNCARLGRWCVQAPYPPLRVRGTMCHPTVCNGVV